MRVSRQFRNDFETVVAHYGVTDEERKLMEDCITPENLADWAACFRDVAARVDPPSVERTLNAKWDEERRLNPPEPRDLPPLATLDKAKAMGVQSRPSGKQTVSMRYKQ